MYLAELHGKLSSKFDKKTIYRSPYMNIEVSQVHKIKIIEFVTKSNKGVWSQHLT